MYCESSALILAVMGWLGLGMQSWVSRYGSA